MTSVTARIMHTCPTCAQNETVSVDVGARDYVYYAPISNRTAPFCGILGFRAATHDMPFSSLLGELRDSSATSCIPQESRS
jgi:hypothetical protein